MTASSPGTGISVAPLSPGEVPDFISLVREVYDEFVAPGYSEEGNDTFYGFIGEEAVRERMDRGNLMAVAKAGGVIVGAHEVRDGNHIALFFVKKEWQGRGIGGMLFRYSLDSIARCRAGLETITVNSSPRAEGIYASLGFRKTMEMQETNGIRYVPMEYVI
jgi:GNAT superfamily N-acetyltransferase